MEYYSSSKDDSDNEPNAGNFLPKDVQRLKVLKYMQQRKWQLYATDSNGKKNKKSTVEDAWNFCADYARRVGFARQDMTVREFKYNRFGVLKTRSKTKLLHGKALNESDILILDIARIRVPTGKYPGNNKKVEHSRVANSSRRAGHPVVKHSCGDAPLWVASREETYCRSAESLLDLQKQALQCDIYLRKLKCLSHEAALQLQGSTITSGIRKRFTYKKTG